jgi:GNAT superfamily N-acetyltransferase
VGRRRSDRELADRDHRAPNPRTRSRRRPGAQRRRGLRRLRPGRLTAGEQPDPAGPTAELVALLVEPRWGRRGHGSRLLAAVSDLARSGGAARLQVWLLESDRVSAGFYESAGWAPDGWARTLDTGGVPLREIRWHALLVNPDAAQQEGAQ